MASFGLLGKAPDYRQEKSPATAGLSVRGGHRSGLWSSGGERDQSNPAAGSDGISGQQPVQIGGLSRRSGGMDGTWLWCVAAKFSHRLR